MGKPPSLFPTPTCGPQMGLLSFTLCFLGSPYRFPTSRPREGEYQYRVSRPWAPKLASRRPATGRCNSKPSPPGKYSQYNQAAVGTHRCVGKRCTSRDTLLEHDNCTVLETSCPGSRLISNTSIAGESNAYGTITGIGSRRYLDKQSSVDRESGWLCP